MKRIKKPDPERITPDNPEWTRDRIRRARPAASVLPDLVSYSKKRHRGQRGPQKKAVKVALKIRIDPDVVDAYKAGGPGWQTRMNEVLRRGIKRSLSAR
jgi:uncharacterized protein (DUF4415 family)